MMELYVGYYTRYELDVIDNPNNADLAGLLAKQSGYEDCFDDSIKWYSHQKDCLAVSKMHPEATFSIKGIGEEFADAWVECYKGGALTGSWKLEVKFPKFDKNGGLVGVENV